MSMMEVNTPIPAGFVISKANGLLVMTVRRVLPLRHPSHPSVGARRRAPPSSHPPRIIVCAVPPCVTPPLRDHILPQAFSSGAYALGGACEFRRYLAIGKPKAQTELSTAARRV